ncbi:COP9 signalosome complex subunit 6, partial [Tremellales sp. Uapishka_1]
MSTSAKTESNAIVLSGGVSSGLTIKLHPLPLLNISEHHTRSRFVAPSPPKLIGALLGTLSNREVSIVNTFELTFASPSQDVDMFDASVGHNSQVDNEFFETRKEQFKQVFPSLEVVGWYSVGKEPSSEDIDLHRQFANTVDTPIFLLFDSVPPPQSPALPINIYESFLDPSGEGGEENFVALDFGIETGEAERIAVDGVSKGTSGDGEESALISNLTTQRNAIRMLYERIQVLLSYVDEIINSQSTFPHINENNVDMSHFPEKAKPDYTILRQISALVATLPTMNAPEFKEELMTEYSDVQLTAYLTALTKQLSVLANVSMSQAPLRHLLMFGQYTDKHNIIYPPPTDELSGGRGGKGFNLGSGGFTGRRRGLA